MLLLSGKLWASILAKANLYFYYPRPKGRGNLNLLICKIAQLQFVAFCCSGNYKQVIYSTFKFTDTNLISVILYVIIVKF